MSTENSEPTEREPIDRSPMPNYVAAIDLAETAFRDCWKTLVKIKENKLSSSDASLLFEFQPNLAQALFNLDTCFREILAYGGLQVRLKKSLITAEFLASVRRASTARKALINAMEIGRSLGDAFAWVFYMNSQPLFRQHLQHDEIRHTPPGLGGAGELAFLRSVSSDTHFILYHGITNFLRVGDVSFVDKSTWNVTGIGELKTEIASEELANISLHLVGILGTRLPHIYHQEKSSVIVPRPRTNHKKTYDKSRQKARLKRQMSEMSKMLNNKAADETFSMHDAYHTEQLVDLGKQLESNSIGYVKIGDGLLLSALLIEPGKPLSERLLTQKSVAELIAPALDLPLHTAKILDQNRSNNRLSIGTIETKNPWGTLPIFWWRTETFLLEKIYFQEALLLSIYNSVFLVEKLRKAGFTVIEKQTMKSVELEVSMIKEDAIGRIENFFYFEHLISQQLMREEQIVRGLIEVHSKAPSPKGAGIKILFDFVHRM